MWECKPRGTEGTSRGKNVPQKGAGPWKPKQDRH